MFRKERKASSYRKDNLLIKTVSLGSEYSIGDWSSYSWIKLVYLNKQKDDASHRYLLSLNNEIIGYIIANEEVNLIDNEVLNMYDRKMVLCDFAIDNRRYAYYGEKLINYLLDIARKKGFLALEIKKNQEFVFFNNFIKRHYNVVESFDNYYIFIKNTRAIPFQNNLKIFKDDKLSIEDLYYLYKLNFNIYKNCCICNLNEKEKIIVHRKNGQVELPSNIINRDNIYYNDKIKSLIFLLKEMYYFNKIKEIFINKKIEKEIDIYIENEVLIFDKLSNIYQNYYLLNSIMINYGYKEILIYEVKYDFNDQSIDRDFVNLDIKKYLSKKKWLLDLNYQKLSDIIDIKRQIKEFNEKIENIKKFEFEMGSSFSGIKKFIIDFDNEKIRHNGQKKDNINFNKKEIINELKELFFSNWRSSYFREKGNIDYSWKIVLTFRDEKYNYEGVDYFPNIWFFVLKFVEKYSSIKFFED